VRHHVDVPVATPAFEVRLAQVPTRREHAGIRAEQIDLPVVVQDTRDERRDLILMRNVAAQRRRALGRAVDPDVGYDDRSRTFLHEAACEASADAAAATRHDDHPILEVHANPSRIGTL
jgi:hypothetical protein